MTSSITETETSLVDEKIEKESLKNEDVESGQVEDIKPPGSVEEERTLRLVSRDLEHSGDEVSLTRFRKSNPDMTDERFRDIVELGVAQAVKTNTRGEIRVSKGLLEVCELYRIPKEKFDHYIEQSVEEALQKLSITKLYSFSAYSIEEKLENLKKSIDSLGFESGTVFKKASEEAFGQALAEGRIDTVFEIAKHVPVSEEIFSTPEVVTLIAEYIGGRGDLYDVTKIAEKLPDHVLASSQIHKAAVDIIARNRTVETSAIEKAKQVFGLADEDIYEAVLTGVVRDAIALEEKIRHHNRNYGRPPSSMDIESETEKELQKHNIPSEYLSSSRNLENGARLMAGAFKTDSFEMAERIAKGLALPEIVFKASEVRKEAEKKLVDRLTDGRSLPPEEIVEIKDRYGLQETFLQSKKFKEAINKNAREYLKNQDRFSDRVLFLHREFGLDDELMRSPDLAKKVRNLLMEELGGSQYHRTGDAVKAIEVVGMIKGFGIEELGSLLKDEHVKHEATVRFKALLSGERPIKDGSFADQIEFAHKYAEEFGLAEKDTGDQVRGALARSMARGGIDNSQKLIEVFGLRKDMIDDSLDRVMRHLLIDSDFKPTTLETINQLKEAFQLSENVVKEYASQALIEAVKSSSFDEVVALRDSFGLVLDISTKGIEEALMKAIANEISYSNGDGEYKQLRSLFKEIGLDEKSVSKLAAATLKGEIEDHRLSVEDTAVGFYALRRHLEDFNISPDDTETLLISVILKSRTFDTGYYRSYESLKTLDYMGLDGQKLFTNAAREALRSGMPKNYREILRENPDIILDDAEVQKLAREGCQEALKKGDIYNYKQIIDRYNPGDEFINSEEVKSLVGEAVIKNINKAGSKGYHPETYQHLISYLSELGIAVDFLQSEGVQEPLRQLLDKEFDKWNLVNSLKFIQTYNALLVEGQEERKDKLKLLSEEGFLARLQEGLGQKISEQQRLYRLDQLSNALCDGLIDYQQQAEAIRPFIETIISRELTNGNYDKILRLKEVLSTDGEHLEYLRQEAINTLIALVKTGDTSRVTEIVDKLSLSKEDTASPEVQNLLKVAKLFCNFEVEPLAIENFQVGNLSENELAAMFGFARQEFEVWEDEQNICEPFQAGAETFGYKRMLNYINREGLSLHDALHNFRDILKLFTSSGFSESEFYGKILQQVQMDNSEYPEGTAHHRLNAIARTMNNNVAEVVNRSQDYKEIEKLHELITTFDTPQTVFESWGRLKRYSDLEQLLGRTEILDELKKLKSEGKDELYRYVETLAFHRNSKIDTKAVLMFWRDPKTFMSAQATHSPDWFHDRLKPSNYIEKDNLDLSAVGLRDALVEGSMDGLSTITPLEIRYKLLVEGSKPEPLPERVRTALGSFREGVEGEARDRKKLFGELGKLLKPLGARVDKYIQGEPLPDSIDLTQKIEGLLYDPIFGMERPKIKTREFVVRINKKSDPEGAIAGNDTGCCMPYGDGKQNVYMFNPNCAQLVFVVMQEDGTERTIAQSVLTKDINIKTLVPDVIHRLTKEKDHIADVLPAEILSQEPAYIVCDNVEVAPNYQDAYYQKIIEALYKDFFKEYMKRNAKKQGLSPEKVIIGKGYSDAFQTENEIENTFYPQAGVSYSDNIGDMAFVLDLGSDIEGVPIIEKQFRETTDEKREEPTLPEIKGLGYLTFEDTLSAAYLESKAYADNQSLMQLLSSMQNSLIAKDINNEAKDRPNMSLKYTDESGRMRGYMLAWEGALSDTRVRADASEFFEQPCIYIEDLAADKESRLAGGRMIQGFTDLYKKNYLDQGNFIPIYAQARESTSFRIVKRQLDRIGKEVGVMFDLIELPTYEVGGDVMHPIIICPKKGSK